jgi:hypothetical protein
MLVQALFGLLDNAGMKNVGMDVDEHGNTEKLKNWLEELSICLDERAHAISPAFCWQALRASRT